jgi:hypothetical protein
MSRTDAQRLRDWRKANPERVKELEVHSTERVRAWRKANPERAKENSRRWREEYVAREGITPRTAYRKSRFKNKTQAALLVAARKRAKLKGFEFNLELSDIVIPERCPVFGTPFSYDKVVGRTNPDTPSIDRIRNSEGYIKGNICVISHRANIMKGSMTLSDCEAVVAYMRRMAA